MQPAEAAYPGWRFRVLGRLSLCLRGVGWSAVDISILRWAAWRRRISCSRSAVLVGRGGQRSRSSSGMPANPSARVQSLHVCRSTREAVAAQTDAGAGAASRARSSRRDNPSVIQSKSGFSPIHSGTHVREPIPSARFASTRASTGSCASMQRAGASSTRRPSGARNARPPSVMRSTQNRSSCTSLWCVRHSITKLSSLVSPPSAQCSMWWPSAKRLRVFVQRETVQDIRENKRECVA